MKKRVWATMLAAAMVLATGSTTVCASEGEAGGTVSVWCWDDSYNIPAVELAAEIYKEEVPDFALEVTNISFDDIVTRLTTAAAGGQEDTLPNIMLVSDTNIQKFVTLYPDYFADLTDSGIDFTQFAPYKVEAGTVDGRIYSVPFDSGVSMAVYRTDLLEPTGLTIEDLTDLTWEEFIEKCEPAVQKTGVPMLITAQNNHLLNCMLQSSGHWYFDSEGKLDLVNNEGLRATFEIYKQLVDKKILQVVADMESYYSSYYEGASVGTINACWIMNNLKKDENLDGNLRITNMPRFSNVEGASNAGNTGGSSWVIFNKDNKDLAIDYMNKTFAGSPELHNELLARISAVSTYLPSAEQPNYTMEQEFFGGQKVFQQLLGYSDTVPRVNYGIYTAEAADAVRTALFNYISGSQDLDSALQEAEQNVSFLMQ